MRYNQDMLDTLTLVSFLIAIANYNENITQSDKDDMMQALDEKTTELLRQLETDLEEQNKMLVEILDRVSGK